MSEALSAIVRMHREAICTAYKLCIRQDRPPETTAESALYDECDTVLEALIHHWEQGDEGRIQAWAQRHASLAAAAGYSPGEVVSQLDGLSQALRVSLATTLVDRSALLEALARLDDSLRISRRGYLEAHEALMARHVPPPHDYGSLYQRSYALQVLSDFAQRIGYTLSYDELVRRMLESLSRVLPHDVAASILRTDQGCNLCLRPTRPLTLPVQEDIQRRLLHGLSLMHDHLKQVHLHTRILESELLDAARPPLLHLGSVVQVPLIVGQTHEVVGLLLVGAEHHEAFTEEQVCLLYTVADQTSLSLQRLQAFLVESQQRLESLLEHLPDGVILLDPHKRLVLANLMAREYLAVLTDAGVSDVLTVLGDCAIEMLLQGAPGRASYEVKTLELPLRVFDVDVCLLEGGSASQGWILVMRDVTEDRQLQKRLQQQERLTAVGQLAAGIAHDFNNLLTGIIGYAYLLQKHAEMPETAQPMLARIVTQVERGAHLVRQIVDFSRSSISQLQRLDLARFVKNAIRFLERTIPENIRIVLDVEPGEYIVLADTTRFQQVLMNLAINAADAMPAGGELRLCLSQLTLAPGARQPALDMPPGAWQVLTVSDTGMGIAAEDLSRVFEPFFTTKEPGKGSGLGLAQVYGIVKQHDGHIRAESQVGGGTTMAIYLPVVTRETQRPIDVAAPMHPAAIPSGNGETVLLVEDEPAVLEVCYVLLKELGYEVLTATNGQQAIEVYTAHQADIALVLLDLVMPEMGGVELFNVLQQMDPTVKVVIMTGYPLEEEGKQSLVQGILAWVQKPPSIEQLARIIRRVLAG